MGRGYLRKSGESIELVHAIQGTVIRLDGNFVWDKALRFAAVADGPDGLFRVKLSVDRFGGRVAGHVKVGARVEAAKEAARLRGQVGRQTTTARTASPGIYGYQQRADAASERLRCNHRETVRLAEWLEGSREAE